MPSHSHTELFSNSEFVLKALTTKTIPEPAVEVLLNGKLVGKFQGLEMFEKVREAAAFPQTIADLVSNNYFRLTYQKNERHSATFGSSCIGGFSIRTAIDGFCLIPAITKAQVDVGAPHRLKITVIGKFKNTAEVKIIKTYATVAKQHRTCMFLECEFRALKDIKLDEPHLGQDSFRLFSFSSMYANPDCYDGNLLSWSGVMGKEGRLNLKAEGDRESYLIKEKTTATEIRLIKEPGSRAKINSPGSTDSPSVSFKLLDCSIPLDQIGIQAYLSKSIDANDDSLSVWAEWLAAPTVIKSGTIIFFNAECSAFPC